jgi:hypothetical protein
MLSSQRSNPAASFVIAAYDDIPEHQFEVVSIEEDHVTGFALTGPLAGSYGEPDLDLIIHVNR